MVDLETKCLISKAFVGFSLSDLFGQNHNVITLNDEIMSVTLM